MNNFENCLHKKRGIELVEPNSNLAQAYIIRAEESLKERNQLKTRYWKITITYYAMYFALYSILRKIGVKCEIHTCTVSFMKKLLAEQFTKEDVELLEMAMKARVDEQYYTDRYITSEQYETIINTAPVFVTKCKNIILTDKKIEQIRTTLKR